MSISGSLFVASNALDAFGNSISVAGDNIANVNTVGFKASRTEFADLLPTVSGQIETGNGVRLADVSRPFQQGTLESTQQVTDLAIEGNGFFILKNGAGDTFYSRAGEFHVDGSGNLVNPLNYLLQGSSGNIAVDAGTVLPAQATGSLGLVVNLDAAATTPSAAFPAGPDASSSAWNSASNFSSITTIYDSAGAAHDLTFLFSRTAPNSWDYRVVAPRSELDSSAPTSTDLRDVSAGTLAFNADGTLNPGGSTVSAIGPLNWVSGSSQTISAGSLSFAGSVQYAQPSSLTSLTSDGSAAGSLTGISIDGQGVITGRFSNGASRTIDTISLANFANVDDLDPAGDGLLKPTLESGGALVGTPGQNELGHIAAGSLEMSTVDLAHEFVSLITSQRSFQVNSRVITTADQMYADAANLKV